MKIIDYVFAGGVTATMIFGLLAMIFSSLHEDNLSAIFLILTGLGGLLIFVCSFKYLTEDTEDTK